MFAFAVQIFTEANFIEAFIGVFVHFAMFGKFAAENRRLELARISLRTLVVVIHRREVL